MNESFVVYASLILLIAFLIPMVLFLLMQQNTLKLITMGNRRMSPGAVWFQLIPLFGMVWQFFVIRRISHSIEAELNEVAEDSPFVVPEATVNRPTLSMGMAYAILICCSIIPIPVMKPVFSLAALVCWVVYWSQLAGFKKRLRERSLVAGSAVA